MNKLSRKNITATRDHLRTVLKEIDAEHAANAAFYRGEINILETFLADFEQEDETKEIPNE